MDVGKLTGPGLNSRLTLGKFFGFEAGIDLRPIKADNYVTCKIYDWNAPLSGFLDRLHARCRVLIDIYVFIRNAEFI